MAFNPSSPITGAAVTGLTSPTYTLTADNAPTVNSKQWIISALGGTQTGVDTHSVSKPFTLTVFRPAQLAVLAPANPLTGVIAKVPNNTYKVIGRKGVLPSANQAVRTARCTITLDIPAGSDSYEPEDIKALISMTVGALYAQASGIADTTLTGII